MTTVRKNRDYLHKTNWRLKIKHTFLNRRFFETDTASLTVCHKSTEYEVYLMNQLLTEGLIVPLEKVIPSFSNTFISLMTANFI